MTTMTTERALEIVADIASRWGENQEEGFSRRLLATDTDEDAKTAAEDGGNEPEDGIEVRDLWRAIEQVQAILKQRGCEHFDPAIDDGKLTSLCDLVIYG
jgi:hypothetical protein